MAVEIAETILQRFESAEEHLAPAFGLAPGKRAAKEFGRIAHLLDLDAQLVSAERIEFTQLAAALEGLLPALFQFLDRELSNGALALQLQQGIAGCEPLPGFNPFSEVDQQKAKSCRGHSNLRAPKRPAALLFEFLRTKRRLSNLLTEFDDGERWEVSAARATSTSISRAGPNALVIHFSSPLSLSVRRSRTKSPNSEIAARNRRNATLAWCRPSGSPRRKTGTLSAC